jgi:hypothetical protein
MTVALRHYDSEAAKGFWCDGIVLSEPEAHYLPQWINDNRQVYMKAYIGTDGQTEYDLLLKFGPLSLSRYARGLDITSCIPNDGTASWLTIDVAGRMIEVQLL